MKRISLLILLMFSILILSSCDEEEKTTSSSTSIVTSSSVSSKSETIYFDFETASFFYDGTEKSIYVNDLDEKYTVEYIGNSKIDAGVYPVTARIYLKEDNSLVSEETANLIIEKVTPYINIEDIKVKKDQSYLDKFENISNSDGECSITFYDNNTNVLDTAPTTSGNYSCVICYTEGTNYLSLSKTIKIIILSEAIMPWV